MAEHYLGIDVGTGSARAGVFDPSGALLASSKRDIKIFREAGDIVEQSSNDIWQAVASCVRQAVKESGVAPGSIAGIGFDATCSLVVVAEGGRPMAVSASGDEERNIIVWMDHRATDQARRINVTGHRVLDYVGGAISPEMETPKLLWLAENRPAAFDERLAVYGSRRLSDMAVDGKPGPVRLHGDVQMDIPRPRRSLG